jgi:hypothetical protein
VEELKMTAIAFLTAILEAKSPGVSDQPAKVVGHYSQIKTRATATVITTITGTSRPAPLTLTLSMSPKARSIMSP